MLYSKIILCLACIFACFLTASALTPTAPENCIREIFSIGYDVTATKATIGVYNPTQPPSIYYTAPIQRVATKEISIEVNRSLFGPNAQFDALEGYANPIAPKGAVNAETSIVPYQAWPNQGGFLGGYSQAETAQRGQILSRIGDLCGTYVSPPGASLSARGLPSAYPNTSESLWEVVKPFNMQGRLAAPWQDATGGGIQYKMEQSVQNLWDKSFIKPAGGP